MFKPTTLVEDIFSSNVSRGLDANLFLCVNAKILLTGNVKLSAGLVNGATGVLHEIVYKNNRTAPSLPKFVLVDFGNQYKGPTFPPNYIECRGWVLVHPSTSKWYTAKYSSPGNDDEHTCTILYLRLCWAWIVLKAQGQTTKNKFFINMGKREKEHGLTYVSMSPVTKFSNIGIHNGITFNWSYKCIRNHKKMTPRIHEETCLHALCAETIKMLTLFLNIPEVTILLA